MLPDAAAERHSRINRLKWQCRRALLELDLVFVRFWARCGDRLEPAQEIALGRLLAREDHDLWALVSGRADTATLSSDEVSLLDELRRV